MEVTFYNMTSPSIKISKELGAPLKTTSAEPQPTGPVSVVDPILIVDAAAIPSNANYFTVGEPLNRAYFLVSIEYTTAKTAIVTGHSDVLSNFAPSGTMNFIRGADSLTEMDDASYPISDYMVEEYFPMTTWTDIFSNKGSGRQYLLRTVCSTPKTYPSHALTSGNVFCDSNLYYIRESDDAVMYKCYQFDSSNTTGRTPSYVPRQDLTGITIIYGGDYITCDGHTWRWISETQVGKEGYPYLNFLT